MKKTMTLIAVTGLFLAGLTVQSKAQQAPSAEDMQDLMKAMHAMASAASNATPVVDFRELKALLPADLQDMKRSRANGEKSAAMGMTVSYAEASYEATDGGTIEIKISDMGGMGGFMAAAQASWTMTDIDCETDTGFERTTMMGNFKAHEEYDNTERSGDVQVMVANRYLVEISGNNVSIDQLRAAAKKMDLQKLAALKPTEK